jgi:UDP-3-O-[3-hydroxymyristoyl] glucosamine N-acyltransferase
MTTWIIGRGTILHSGAVIGADGFGYVMDREASGCNLDRGAAIA